MAYDYRYGNQSRQQPAPLTTAAPAAKTDPATTGAAAGAVGSMFRSAFAPINGGGAAQPQLPPVSFQGNLTMPRSQNGAKISTGRNPNGYRPTTAPFGMDMSAPGVGEQFWNNNQNMWFNSPSLDWVDQQLPQFEDPWAGEQSVAAGMGTPGSDYTSDYWAGIQGSMNTPGGAESIVSGGYKGPNNAQTAFDMTKGALPGSLQPQFDAYYARMAQKAMSNGNSQSAARGVYGSNSALNNSIGAGLDVEAERAKAATDFSLDDSANQRAWFDSLGTAGRNADLSGQGAFGLNLDASRFGLDKTKTLGDIAFNADTADLNRDKFDVARASTLDDMKRSRLDSGISTAFGSDAAHRGQLQDAYGASNTAQDQREGRINTLYNQLSGFGSDVQNFFGQYYNQIIGEDGQLNEQGLQTMIAQAADERGWDQQQQERIMRDIKTAIDGITGAKEAGVF